MKLQAILLSLLLLIATLFSIYGQDMTYSLYENMPEQPLMFYLTAITFSSVILYLISFLLTYSIVKKKEIRIEIAAFIFVPFALIAMPTTMFSLFVLLMWRG